MNSPFGGERFFLASQYFFLGLEPVVEFRAGLVTALNLEFVRSALNLFFE
jgi:hypothetical protein